MAKLKVYPAGFTAYQPSAHLRQPPPRGSCSGWTASSVRRLVRWLYSLSFPEIDAPAFSFTLTVRDCPPSSDEWKRACRAFFERCRRLGVDRIFWLIEWQRRGVPHLHGIAVLPTRESYHEFIPQWLAAAKAYRPTDRNQTLREIYDPTGWAEYLGKHSARGVQNYQRNSANIPKAWQGKTGRMWGHRGPWPTRPPMELGFTEPIFFRLRRLIRSRAISLARDRQDPKSIKFARAMLQCSDPVVSRIRAVSNFLPMDDTLTMLEAVANGETITQ